MTSVTFTVWFRGVSCDVMSNHEQSPESGDCGPDGAVQSESASSVTPESGKGEAGRKRSGRGRYPDMQSAVRFPIHLPVAVKSQSGASAAETQNISANGVLFQVDSEMPVGSLVDFTISLPANVVGAEVDVQLDCRGRVVRSFEEEGRRGVGVVIDEYHFERR
jgi:PilZ domain